MYVCGKVVGKRIKAKWKKRKNMFLVARPHYSLHGYQICMYVFYTKYPKNQLQNDFSTKHAKNINCAWVVNEIFDFWACFWSIAKEKRVSYDRLQSTVLFFVFHFALSIERLHFAVFQLIKWKLKKCIVHSSCWTYYTGNIPFSFQYPRWRFPK